MRVGLARPALILLGMIACAGAAAGADRPALTADQEAALGRISADSMRGHLSFLASDLLEGRGTPSRGLDLAAEYIAAQFRRAGLEPAGNDGYFQSVRWPVATPDPSAFQMEIQAGPETYRIEPSRVSLLQPRRFEVAGVETVKIDFHAAAPLEALKPDDVEGKAVLVEIPEVRSGPRAQWAALVRSVNEFVGRLAAWKPALVVNVSRDETGATGLGSGPLVDPEARGPAFLRSAGNGPPRITVHDPRLVALFDAMPPGPGTARVSLRLPEPVDRLVTLRNVIGYLPGSEPALKDTFVLVTAHYDHLGIGAPVAGDAIYNGANDDGSGTVSVIELASALATLKERPKRSLVFLAFFGEELGLLGSRYYARHAIFPLGTTVADLNLEQIGRTDSTEGPQVATASVTGIDFSEVGSILQAAGEAEGIRVYKHPVNSDAYFGASDNRSLAELGVPAHSVTVAYAYPDYHGALDHWDKVDFANMAKVDRMIGRALLMLAESAEPPRWSETNPKAGRFLNAWKKLRGR